MDIPHRNVNIKSNDTTQDTPEKKKTDLPKVNIPTIRFDKTIESVQREDITKSAEQEIQSYSITPRRILREYELAKKDQDSKIEQIISVLSKHESTEEEVSKILPGTENKKLKSIKEKLKYFFSVSKDVNEFFYFIETYHDHHIQRFGIALNHQYDSMRYSGYNEDVESISTKTGSQKTKSNNTTSSVSSQPKDAFRDEKIVKILHPVEIDLFKKAIEKLKSSEYKASTILVDIFKRSSDGSIDIDDNIPEIHTVVLHLQKDKVGLDHILLIDPTSSEFSYHVADFINHLILDKEIHIIIPPKSLQIYTPVKDKTGPGSNETRDCVDVSFKIAFEIEYYINHNGQALGNTGNIDSWKAWQPLVNISNQVPDNKGLDHILPKGLLGYVRIKQSGDDNIRTTFYKVCTSIAHLRDAMVKVVPQDTRDQVSEKITGSFKDICDKAMSYNSYNDTLAELLKIYTNFNREFHSILVQEYNDLTESIEVLKKTQAAQLSGECDEFN